MAEATFADNLHTTASRSGDNFTSAAAALAYAGALPLILIASAVWARPAGAGDFLRELTILYGGLLLAFFGGVRWGIAVMRAGGPSFAHLAGAIAPLALAMPVFLLPGDAVRLAVIVLALPVLLADDLRATRAGCGAPGWYLNVRLPLTVMMEAALIAILAHAVIR